MTSAVAGAEEARQRALRLVVQLREADRRYMVDHAAEADLIVAALGNGLYFALARGDFVSHLWEMDLLTGELKTAAVRAKKVIVCQMGGGLDAWQFRLVAGAESSGSVATQVRGDSS